MNRLGDIRPRRDGQGVNHTPKLLAATQTPVPPPKVVAVVEPMPLPTFELPIEQEPVVTAANPAPTKKTRRAGKLTQWFKRSKPKKPLMHRILVGMALVVFLAGIAVATQGFLLNRNIRSTQVSAAQANSSQEKPDETEPSKDDIAAYTVAPNMPRYVLIPKSGTKARVRAVGVDKNNKLEAPKNIFDTGWYSSSAKPGSSSGTSVIDGHVSGWTKKGSLYALKGLSKGDKVVVERGDGKQFTYRVVATETHDAATMDMSKVMQSKNPAKHGLNLITCTGRVTPGTNDYEKRLVVYTEIE